jgi:hypothetical protein
MEIIFNYLCFIILKNQKPIQTLKTRLWGEIAQALIIGEKLVLIVLTNKKIITFILTRIYI